MPIFVKVDCKDKLQPITWIDDLKLIIQVTHKRRAASMCVTFSMGGQLSDDTHDYDDTTDQ